MGTDRFARAAAPPPPFVVGAVACATARANAAGVVRLRLSARGLEIELLRVGRFETGFALAGVGRATRLSVPYQGVRALLRQGPFLHLGLDPRVVQPFNRFSLARFGPEPAAALWRRLWAGRVVVALRWLVPPALTAAAVVLVPRSAASGLVGRVALGVLVALASFTALGRVSRWLTWGGPVAEHWSRRFERELSSRLGLAPSTVGASSLDFVPDAARLASDRPLATAARLLGTTLRPRALAALVLGVAFAVGALVLVGRFGVVSEVKLPVARAQRGVAAPLASLGAAAADAIVPTHPACSCARPDSPLWSAGVPSVALLAVPRKGDFDPLWIEPGQDVPVRAVAAVPTDPPPRRRGRRRRGREGPRAPELQLELAAVNNSSKPVAPMTAVLTFAQRNERGERVGFVERGVYWPRLEPGAAVKWRLEGEGTEFRVDTPLARLLGDDRALARADAFAALEKARLPEVRLHGAMMLAYLGDERSEAALDALAPGTHLAERDAIRRTLAPIYACEARPHGDGSSVCVVNRTGVLARSVTLREVGGEQRSWAVEDLFFPSRGLRVELPLGGNSAPRELVVEPPSAPHAAE